MRRSIVGILVVGAALSLGTARAEDDAPPQPPRDLVKAANAPLSDILQLRVQNTYVPELARIEGDTDSLLLSITMPLPEFRLMPFPQLSLLSVPAAVTSPDDRTDFGDVRFVNVAVLDPGHEILVGIGPTFVFPSASERTSGQGKWQAGPAVAIAYAPARWLVGLLAQNPISFAGDRDRPDTNALFLQPFATYQLGAGWFLRSQPQIVVDWESGGRVVPLDLGVGRVFRIGRQHVNLFVEPSWTVSHAGAGAPLWGITVGGALLYPNFWRAE